MSAQDFSIAFVIWRESIEALLVVGILQAWLAMRPAAERRRGRLWLWSGVLAGLAGAGALGAMILGVTEILSDEAQEVFQTALLLLAAGLIVQMVVWMRAHGRRLKAELHNSLSAAADRAHWMGVFLLAMIAVLREGSEAVVFVYGIMVGAAASPWRMLAAVGLGFVAAGLSYALLQAGSRLFGWRLFFRITEAMLLLLAGALLVNGLDHVISLGLLPWSMPQLWDSSSLLPDTGAFGGLVSALTGYRAKPVAEHLVVLAIYWIGVIWLLKRPHPQAA